ncbi:metallophosphoesterase [Phocaeicola coprophilus]
MKTILSAFLLICCSLISQAQVYPVNANLEDEKSFSMILLPDPQSYIKFAANQPLFDLQTAWIANNIETLHIKNVLCTGDLVEQNSIIQADGINGDQTSREQWEAVSRSFEKLDGKVPYVVCTGNHDYGYKASEKRFTQFRYYFYPERNRCLQESLIAAGNNYEGLLTLENAVYEFISDTWGKILVLSLEFAPRDEAIEWARHIIGDKKYKDHKVILLTHSFLDYEGKRFITENYQMQDVNYAEALWQKLVYPSDNIKLVICGHECYITDYAQQVSFRTDKNHSGNEVAQMMFNAQTADGQWFGNGGDCWLRILEFKPDGKTISVRTFSPLFALSPTTCQYAWRKQPFDQFNITLTEK